MNVYGNVDLATLLTATKQGEFNQRLLAVQTLEGLVRLGLVTGKNAESIMQLRSLVNVSQQHLISRGVYVVRITGAIDDRQRDLIIVGYCTDWRIAEADLIETYGLLHLVMFVHIEDEYPDADLKQWMEYICGLLKNNESRQFAGMFALSERRTRELIQVVTDLIAFDKLDVTVFYPPVLGPDTSDATSKINTVVNQINVPSYQQQAPYPSMSPVPYMPQQYGGGWQNVSPPSQTPQYGNGVGIGNWQPPTSQPSNAWEQMKNTNPTTVNKPSVSKYKANESVPQNGVISNDAAADWFNQQYGIQSVQKQQKKKRFWQFGS